MRTSASPWAVTTLTYFSAASRQITSETGIIRTVLPTPARMTLIFSGASAGSVIDCTRSIRAAMPPAAGVRARSRNLCFRRCTQTCRRSSVAGLSM
ncbi:hypothetical protein D9M70_644590 [compost metagenome]